MLACVRSAEELRPLNEAKVGRDDDAGVFIDLAQKVEQQRAAGRAERQVFECIHCPAGARKACCREERNAPDLRWNEPLSAIGPMTIASARK